MTNWNLIRKIVVYVLFYAVSAGMIISLFIGSPYERNDYPLLRLLIIFFATILLTKYFLYMTISPWYDVVMTWKRKYFRKKHSRPYRPLVSVIVPAWNEEVGLLNTVKTILLSYYPHLEIVVINDGSTDNSDAIMQEFIKEYEKIALTEPGLPKLVYQYKQNGGKGAALNRGISIASGEIIISIDADCVLKPDTVANFVKCFEDRSVMAAVGNVKIGNTHTLLGTLQYLEFLFSFYFKKADSLLNTIYIIGGAAGAFRRQVFETIGYYSDKNITEDIDLSVRIQDAGMKIVYAADAVVYTEGAGTIKGLMQQRLRWKRGWFQTFSEHGHLFFSTERRHNKVLTWLVLPLAVFGHVQIFFEVLFLIFLYYYAIITNDYSSFISGIVVVSSMFFVQMLDDKSIKRGHLYVLAPIGWLLFYITTVVEYNALIKSIWGMASGRELSWQRWKRQGVLTGSKDNLAIEI